MAEEQSLWRVEEQIPSETGAGKQILHTVLDQAKKHGFPHTDINGVHMALEEALVNAIKHGNREDAQKKVSVVCEIFPEHLRIEVEDEGPGFVPDDVPDPTLPENLERDSGRGIMLMRYFMSSVDFNETGNRVIMEKQRSSSTSCSE